MIFLHLLAAWLVGALALWLAAKLIPGIYVAGFRTAMIAALVIGIVNATLGLVLKIFTLPLTLVTLGLFLLILNAGLLKISSLFVPGFAVRGFFSAVLGSLVITIVRHVVL